MFESNSDGWVLATIITPSCLEMGAICLGLGEIVSQIKRRNRMPSLIVHDGSKGAEDTAQALAKILVGKKLSCQVSSSWVGDIVKYGWSDSMIICQGVDLLKGHAQSILSVGAGRIIIPGGAYIAQFNNNGKNLDCIFSFPGNKRIFCGFAETVTA